MLQSVEEVILEDEFDVVGVVFLQEWVDKELIEYEVYVEVEEVVRVKEEF